MSLAASRTWPSNVSKLDARARDRRVELKLRGRFLADEGTEHPLLCLAASSKTALLRTEHKPDIGERIVCYFDDLGRITSTVGAHAGGGFLAVFDITPHKRDKIADRLIWLANKDKLGLSDERGAPRHAIEGPAQVRLDNGTILNCRVIDLSLTGAGFEAIGAAPRIGDIVFAGDLRGEVVRSQGRRFGIRFLH